MKKSLKATEYAYWTEVDGNNYVGNRHMMIRMQYVSDNVRKALADVGLFNKGLVNNKEFSENAPNVSKVFPNNLDGMVELTKTPFTMDFEGKKRLRVFIKPNGQNVYADDLYVEDVETAFQTTKHKHTFSWYMQADEKLTPLVYGNNLGIVPPCRVAATIEYNLAKTGELVAKAK